jgi:hypothetical protein
MVKECFFEKNRCSTNRVAIFENWPRADLDRYPMPAFVQIKSGALLRFPFADGRGYGALFASQSVAMVVACLHHIIKNETDNFIR